ncbi:MAG: DUF3427 domain-containing protein [Deltaproteobacteria bacterium]|nr:DUF3427 domain-containing protein [Deltaproteobacteria bacterium]
MRRVHDEVDLSDVRWVRGRYDLGDLDNLYTGHHHHRVRVILQQLHEKVPDVSRMRALGFCAGVGHAGFMAEQFNAKGVPAVAIHGDTPPDERRAALQRLAEGRVRVVFAVDLFNEGVDLPAVDITIQKSERDYSPRTMYRDGALSQTIFQWDSQNATGPDTPTGQRHIHHEQRGSHVLLFARRDRKDERGITVPYTFLGPARYLSHEGAYPMAIRWELLHAIPGAVYPEVRLVA